MVSRGKPAWSNNLITRTTAELHLESRSRLTAEGHLRQSPGFGEESPIFQLDGMRRVRGEKETLLLSDMLQVWKDIKNDQQLNKTIHQYINTSILIMWKWNVCETCVKRMWKCVSHQSVCLVTLRIGWIVVASPRRTSASPFQLRLGDFNSSEFPRKPWEFLGPKTGIQADRLTGWLRHAKYIEIFTSLSERYQFWIHKYFTDICDIFWHFCIASCCHIVMQWYLTLDDSAAPWPLWDQGKKSSEFVVFLRWHTSDAAPLVTKTSTWPYMFFIFLKCFKETVTRSLEHDGHNVTLPRQQKIWRQKDAWNVQPGHDTSPRNLSLKEGFTQHANLMRCVRGAVQCQCHILSKYQ